MSYRSRERQDGHVSFQRIPGPLQSERASSLSSFSPCSSSPTFLLSSTSPSFWAGVSPLFHMPILHPGPQLLQPQLAWLVSRFLKWPDLSYTPSMPALGAGWGAGGLVCDRLAFRILVHGTPASVFESWHWKCGHRQGCESRRF